MSQRPAAQAATRRKSKARPGFIDAQGPETEVLSHPLRAAGVHRDPARRGAPAIRPRRLAISYKISNTCQRETIEHQTAVHHAPGQERETRPASSPPDPQHRPSGRQCWCSDRPGAATPARGPRGQQAQKPPAWLAALSLAGPACARSRLDGLGIERLTLPALNLVHSQANIRPKLMQLSLPDLVLSRQKTQRFPHDLTGIAVQAGPDLVVDEQFKLGRQ